MAYSRWQDDRYWPLFRNAFLKSSFDISKERLEKTRELNSAAAKLFATIYSTWELRFTGSFNWKGNTSLSNI